MYTRDDSPTRKDGTAFDGKQLLSLVRSGQSPFQGIWDINLLILEIEDILQTQVIDIPTVYKGASNYGFHIKLSNRPDVVARLSRGDVNMPNYGGFPPHVLIQEVKFEAAVYKLLRESEPARAILASCLLYHRAQVLRADPGPLTADHRPLPPKDIAGRSLFLFERAEAENDVWYDLKPEGKASVLGQAARIRAALFNFNPPPDFIEYWLRDRLSEQKPESIPVPIGPTREFCIALFTSKIEATIRNIGDMIGWESDNSVVGPIAAAAKQSLLRLVPHIMPKGSDEAFYRLVLEHDDFGLHNMSIAVDDTGLPLVTSLYDWERAYIVPAILSDPLMAVEVDLVANTDGAPSISRTWVGIIPEDAAEYMTYAKQYFEICISFCYRPLYVHAPDYKRAIQAGADARHLWFALKNWRGEDSEGYFRRLGAWANDRLKELSGSPESGIL